MPPGGTQRLDASSPFATFVRGQVLPDRRHHAFPPRHIGPSMRAEPLWAGRTKGLSPGWLPDRGGAGHGSWEDRSKVPEDKGIFVPRYPGSLVALWFPSRTPMVLVSAVVRESVLEIHSQVFRYQSGWDIT